MKKLSRIIGMMCLAALAVGFTSCNKEKVEKDSSFTFEMSEAEGFVADDSKAYIDIAASSVIKWWAGDKIMVYSVAILWRVEQVRTEPFSLAMN